MNISAPFGFVVAVAMVYYAVTSGIKNAGVFINEHAAIVVIGGTVAAALICFPISHFFNIFKVYMRALLGKTKQETLQVINEIVIISQGMNQGQPLEGLLGRVKNSFLKESLELMEQGGLTDEELDEVLSKRVEMQNEKYKREGATYKVIGKFPPAFGLVGTTLGMIALLQSLGEENAFERLGPSMSVALVATFYGLIMANVLIIPMGEHLSSVSEDDLVMRRIVVDGVMLIKERKHPLLVQEYLKSYLSPKERNKMKKGQ
jgi:chemotaxis protein MotA